ncbi:MAG: hypothetical protein HYW65_02445 [Candidatus Liptonbacteria bacterium]|nr:hypothetical protein [Candidatus Liptonbacteria bacterium]
MHGDFTLSLLAQLAEKAREQADLLESFLLSGPVALSPRLVQRKRELRRRIYAREHKEYFYEERRKIERRFYSLLQWLERDGIVVRKGKKKLSLTSRGFVYLKNLRSKRERAVPSREYPVHKSDTLIMVAFDIPEREKWKRRWFREVLRNLGFVFLQKSLWIGKVKIPEELLEDIVRLGLVGSVEIFEISKQGSLRQVTGVQENKSRFS